MSVERFLICYTGDEPPEQVQAAADGYAVEFAPLAVGDPDLERRLSELRPNGYLVNDPGWNPPFLSGESIDAAANLRLVTYMGATLTAEDYAPYFDLDVLRKRQIVLTTTTGTTISVAEGTLALLLALNLRLVSANAARKAGREFVVETRQALHGSVLGIIGMGQIGSRLARLAAALGMRIVYYSKHRHFDVEDELSAEFLELGDLFDRADHVSVHTSFSLSRGLISRDELARARGITLINTAFAPIIDAAALLEALEQGWVRRAAIEGSYKDAYDERLRRIDDERLLLLPFMSWDTTHCHERGWDAYLESLIAFREGRAVPYRIL